MKRLLLTFLALALAPVLGLAQSKPFDITVTGGKTDQTNVIVTVALPDDFKEIPEVQTSDKKILLSEVSAPSLLSSGKSRELHILIPEIKTAQTINLTVAKWTRLEKPLLRWTVVDGMEELHNGGRPLLRYFHKPFDASLTVKGKDETSNPTTKPYHQLFAADGKTIVTNSNQGQYPHHRGIYFGFNNISYGEGKKADVWHCRKGEHTSHEKVLVADAGNLFARQTLQIGWHGQDGMIFANERRELTIYPMSSGTLIEWASELTTPLDKVRLDGDPQHAGFHFRANSAMEKNTKESFFIRPDGKGKLGEERNWLPKGKGGPVNLPWNAMSFVLDGKRYTVVYLDHPDNPKEARQSERAYGRIGTYFEYDLTKEKPLKVKYRLWFQEGEPTVEQCEALSKAFTNPPTAKLSAR